MQITSISQEVEDEIRRVHGLARRDETAVSPGSRKAAAQTPVPLARFVLIPLAARAIGYSERAIHKKIDDGVWCRGREWTKAPDGRRLIDMQAVERWILGSAR